MCASVCTTCMAAYLSATSGFCSHSLSAVGDLVTFGLLGCNRRRVLYALLPSIINIMMGRGEKRSHGYTNTGEGSIRSFPWPASHFDADSHYTHTHLGIWSSHAKSFLYPHARGMGISTLAWSWLARLTVFTHVWPKQATTTAKRLQ